MVGEPLAEVHRIQSREDPNLGQYARNNQHAADESFLFGSPLEIAMLEESLLEDGTYQGYRVSLRLVREGSGLYRPRKLNGPEEVYRFFSGLEDLDREVFYALHLDGKHQIVSCEEVSRGTLTSSLVHPREVYKGAILSSAAGIIVVHNHPSGDPNPSTEDGAVATRLYKSGELLGIPFMDSLIIGNGCYHSMKESCGF